MKATWRPIYRIGGISAWVFMIYSLATMGILVVIGGKPDTSLEVFTLLHENLIVGLLRLDALTLITIPLYYPIFLAICLGLRKTSPAFAAIGGMIVFAGITLFLATPTAFSMVPLSEKYFLATSEAQKQIYLSAGEALMASDMWSGSGAMVGGVLQLIAGCILFAVMFKSKNFHKATAIVGLSAFGLDLFRVFVGIFFPKVSVGVMVVAGTLYLALFPLLARDFFSLSKQENE